jgi:hypothetical protein
MPTETHESRQRGSFFSRHSKHESYQALATPNQSSIDINAGPYNSPYNNSRAHLSQAHLSVSSLPPSPAAPNHAPRQSYGYQGPVHQV